MVYVAVSHHNCFIKNIVISFDDDAENTMLILLQFGNSGHIYLQWLPKIKASFLDFKFTGKSYFQSSHRSNITK